MADALIARRALTATATPWVQRAWPTGVEKLIIRIDETQFTQTGTEAQVVIEYSWDDAQTWAARSETNFEVDGTSRRGPRGVFAGPFRVGERGVIRNPTHYRVSLRRVRGSQQPVLGVETD